MITNIKDLYGGLFNGRKVLVTGHTGFKGTWLCHLLNQLGARVSGYSLDPPTEPNMYNETKIDTFINSHIGDIRDLANLQYTLLKENPEIVIHMAAQPLVRESYKLPVETYSINVMGTVNILESCRHTPSVKAIVNVTTDKCYENKEWHWGYRENEPMGGYDPYSNSKGCSELVTTSYRSSYFNPGSYSQHGVGLASARAGNVIGGGDWASERLIPDFIRSIETGKKLRIRNPYAIRPWEHVLEPLNGYLLLASKLFKEGTKYAQGWNFGPNDSDAKNVEWISARICEFWGEGASFEVDNNPQPHEANYLKLDCSKAKAELGWFPKWDIQMALSSIVTWHKAYQRNEDMHNVTIRQINQFFIGDSKLK